MHPESPQQIQNIQTAVNVFVNYGQCFSVLLVPFALAVAETARVYELRYIKVVGNRDFLILSGIGKATSAPHFF